MSTDVAADVLKPEAWGPNWLERPPKNGERAAPPQDEARAATQDDRSDWEPCVTILDVNRNLLAQVKVLQGQVLSLQSEVLREWDRVLLGV